MKRKSIFIIVAIISVAIYFFVFKNKNSLNSNVTDFAISDTSEINKIIFYPKGKTKTILTKEKNKWYVNNNLTARNELVKRLLRVIKNLQLKTIVSPKETDSLSKTLENSMQVEIFCNNDLEKKYFIGKETKNKIGTYMSLKNSENPVVMYIPGFSTDLNNFFYPNPNYWRDNTIFHHRYDKISEIVMEINSAPEKSFKILLDKKQNIDFQNIKGEKKKFKKRAVQRYVSYFLDIDYETIAKDFTKFQKDSLQKIKPIYKIQLKDFKNNLIEIKAYRKLQKNNKDYDFNRMYAVVNNLEEVVIIRFLDFDPILKEIDYFLE